MQRFYQYATWEIWVDMPTEVLNAHVTMLRKLEAEETLESMRAVQAGSGNMTKSGFSAYVNSVEQRTRRERASSAIRPASHEQLARMLGPGVKVTRT